LPKEKPLWLPSRSKLLADVVTKEKRSAMMGAIRGRNTRPEMAVRQGLHSLGFRYRLHDKKIAGKPDLVLPRYNAVIFVHGCFWHRHDCHLFKWPQTRQEFWKEKINGNIKRDTRNLEKLKKEGWRILTVWECALKGKHKLGTDDLLTQVTEWLLSDTNLGTIEGKKA
jgi:DNA mismatch endonuclease (patch repair protein)